MGSIRKTENQSTDAFGKLHSFRPPRGGQADVMAPTTFQDRVATEERMLEHLKANEAELESRGLHVALWIAQLEAATALVKEKDRRQEALKAELKATTADLESADLAAYRLCSGAMDATAAAWGKGTEH